MTPYGYFVMVKNDSQMRRGGGGGGGVPTLNIPKRCMSGVCVDFDLIFLLKI